MTMLRRRAKPQWKEAREIKDQSEKLTLNLEEWEVPFTRREWEEHCKINDLFYGDGKPLHSLQDNIADDNLVASRGRQGRASLSDRYHEERDNRSKNNSNWDNSRQTQTQSRGHQKSDDHQMSRGHQMPVDHQKSRDH